MRRGLVAIGVGALLIAGCGEEPEPLGPAPTIGTQEPPGTPQELVERMVEAVEATGDVLHVTADVMAEEGGVEQHFGSFEGWFDLDGERARVNYEKGPDNATDTVEWERHWFDREDLYRQSPDDDAPREVDVEDSWHRCTGLEPLVAEVLVCGLASQPTNYELTEPPVLVEDNWHGIAAVGIQYVWERTVLPPNVPGRPPTPTPGAGTPTALPAEPYLHRSETVFFVDASTYLPLGLRGRSLRDGMELAGGEVRYTTSLVAPADFDDELFDPRAAGFQTEDEAEMELLDNPEGGGPVYWLGREYDAGEEVGELRLESVEQRFHPERPTLITLYYEAADGDGRLVLEMWESDGWEGFLAMLQEADNNSGRWPFGEACRGVMEFDAGDFDGTMYAGYDYERDDPGGVVVSTPGVEPPTATPFPEVECPEQDYDEFMASVAVGDEYVVSLNATIGIFGLSESYEAFDSVAALRAIAEGLRLREDGE